jgi:hypothetical protein
MYNDEDMSAADVRVGLEALVEEDIAKGHLNRRCEICGKPVIQFLYEDGICKEQDWDKAKAISEQLEVEQMLTRKTVMAARKAGKN